MGTDKKELLHEPLSRLIIGSSMEALNELKPGLDEKLYENALVIDLLEIGCAIEQQKNYPVFYKGKNIGKLIPDLIVNNAVLVDAKVVSDFNASHVAQMLGYLNITGLKVGLLVNFKYSKLQWKRIVS